MNKPIKVEKYGRIVMCNKIMDDARKDECLCLNCRYMGDCVIAKTLYQICKDNDVATMMTRCPQWRDLQGGVKC